MPDDNLPESLPELLDYIERYADSIFVLESGRDGRRKPTGLAKLPGKRALFYAFRFIREGAIPARVPSAEEIAANETAARFRD